MLELNDVQGLVFHAYRAHPFARYLLLRFADHKTPAVRRWLHELVDSERIDSATPKEIGPREEPGIRLNIAFTSSGLRALGLEREVLDTFPGAFVEGLGMPWSSPNADHRSRILGDVRTSAPAAWTWGYQGDDRRVDALLMAFGVDAARVDEAVEHWRRIADSLGAAAGSQVLHGEFPVDLTEPVREPFGFVDGVSQPVMKSARGLVRMGTRRTQPAAHDVEDGEILLGYRDGARQLPASPWVTARPVNGEPAPECVLPKVEDPDITEPDEEIPLNPSDRRDLGRNGTYLVFRQLAQDVKGFNDACRRESQEHGIPVDRLQANLVGRWPDGSSLVNCPLGPDRLNNDAPAANDFSYQHDPLGKRCPIGAHIRRANPRDSLMDNPVESLRISNRHRILRRGRPYHGNGEQGIHFICLNADIVRQFEFIQQNWINDPTFGGLDAEVDRLIAAPIAPPGPLPPAQARVAPLSSFVTVKGGGYFFLPGLTALRYLAGSPPRASHRVRWEPALSPPSFADVVRFLSLTRFSLLLAAILALAPLSLFSGSPALKALVVPMFAMRAYWELALVAMMASLAAAVAMITWRIVQLYAHPRFGVRTGWSEALTWGRVFRWQAASLPWVATAVWVSAPVAEYSRRHLPMTFGFWVIAALAGYVAAFILMYVAEALRDRGVRTDNSQDSVILPHSRRLARWKRSRGITEFRLMKWLAGFVERRIAMWPRERGRGYVDHTTGKILPGHLSVLALMTLTTALYLTGRVLFHPNWLAWRIQVPPAAYLLFLLFSLTWLITSAAFFLDRYRVPLLTLIVAWFLISSTFADADHRFPVVGADQAATWRPGPTAAELLTASDRYAAAHGRAGVNQSPIIVVAAGGGGAYQAAWVARILTGLTDLWGAEFSGNLRFVSAVSAGAVGSMHFLSQYGESGPPVSGSPRVIDGASAPSTGDIWWGFTYYDVPRMLAPLRIARDRGWALEQAWHRALGFTPSQQQPRMTQWQAGVASGWRPAMAFNAMAVESGERVVLATYALPGFARAKSLGQITNNHDIAVVTAARLAASFPYVTPFARSEGDAARLHIADGGYWDNHAIVSALEWLQAAGGAIDGRHVILVKIPPPTPGVQNGDDRSWVWQFPAPLAALESVRTDAQQARNDLDLQYYRQQYDTRQAATPATDGGRFTTVEFTSGGDESLSWHISDDERCRIERRWETYLSIRTELEKLEPILGKARAAASAATQACRR